MLAARRMMGRRYRKPPLDWVGTARNSGGTTYAFSSVTVASRVSGTWTTVSAAAQTMQELGVADAYYVETVVSAVGPSGEHQDWLAGFGNINGLSGDRAYGYQTTYGAPTGHHISGVVVDTNGATWTLYLFHNNSIVLSQPGAVNITAGDTLKVESDFVALTATAYINGVSQASLNFAAESWYTADGQNV